MEKLRKFPKIPENLPERRLYAFSSFRLDPAKRILMRGAELLPISPKTFDLLLTLILHQGEVLLKDELMQSLWPDTVVEEGNLNRHISTLRKFLGESPDDHQYIVTVPGRGYRFVAEVRVLAEDATLTAVPEADTKIPQEGNQSPLRFVPRAAVSEITLPALQAIPEDEARVGGAPGLSWAARLLIGGFSALLLMVALVFTRLHYAKPLLNESDYVLISDFANHTDDPVFDSTLKQAVTVELAQSPFLNILSEARISAALKLMTQPPDVKLTSALTRDLCQRVGARLYIEGSIERLGSQFILGLTALDCRTGDSLAQEQITAENKEHVLQALGQAASRIRNRLGESLSTVHKYDVPLVQATTPSLEALRAFSLGNTARDRQGDAAAIPFYNHAIEEDPSFALAYDALGLAYSNLDEPGLAEKNITKAYSLRERASEREKFQMSANFSQMVTGELEKANQICQLWMQIYPRDNYPHNLLGINYEFLGQYEKAIPELREAIRLNPDGVILRSDLMESLIALNRLNEAKQSYGEALARGLDHPYLHSDRYAIAFLESDQAEMARQVAEAAGHPGGEDLLLSAESDTQSYSGNLLKARELSQRAFQSALHASQTETAALWKMNSALREAEFGHADRAEKDAAAALALAPTRDVQVLGALAYARAGDSLRARKLSNELSQRFPHNSVINAYWIPSIQAAMQINRNDPGNAIEILRAAAAFDSSYPNPQVELGRYLYPIYLRGLAYLRLKKGSEAASEFRRMAEPRSLGLNCPLAALARIGLARAYALQGDTDRARAAYQDVLAQWRDADPDIPILREAKSEYAKLR